MLSGHLRKARGNGHTKNNKNVKFSFNNLQALLTISIFLVKIYLEPVSEEGVCAFSFSEFEVFSLEKQLTKAPQFRETADPYESSLFPGKALRIQENIPLRTGLAPGKQF